MIVDIINIGERGGVSIFLLKILDRNRKIFLSKFYVREIMRYS